MNISELLEALSSNIDSLTGIDRFTGGIIVTLLCMVIVFTVLVVLMFIVKAMKALGGGNKKDGGGESVIETQPGPPVNVTKSVYDGNDEELVAVLTAAVCAAAQASPGSLVVRGITRRPDAGTNWARLVINE